MTLEEAKKAGRFAYYIHRYDTRRLGWLDGEMFALRDWEWVVPVCGPIEFHYHRMTGDYGLPRDIPQDGWSHIPGCDCPLCK